MGFFWMRYRLYTTFAVREFVLYRLLRRIAEPTLTSLIRTHARFFLDVEDMVQQVCTDMPEANVTPDLGTLVGEYEDAAAELRCRYDRSESLGLTYPSNWAVEERTALLLYALIRRTRPKRMLETGVANGHSTYFILRAMRANGVGVLTSIDIQSDVGRLLTKDERSSWDLRVLQRPRDPSGFRSIVEELRPLDIFLHDSEHLYKWQHHELSIALEALSPTGLLLCDDLDSSYAFQELCRAAGLKPSLLLDGSKAFGITRSLSRVPGVTELATL